MMTAIRELIERAGLALYGNDWRRELPRALDIGDRNFRRFLARDEVPPGVLRDLHALLLDHIAELRLLVDDIAERETPK